MNLYTEKLKSAVKGKTAIFIDAANLERSVKDMWVSPKDIEGKFKSFSAEELCWRVDYDKLKKFFASFSDIVKINFYSADFQTKTHKSFLGFMKIIGYKLRTKFLKEYSDHTEELPHRKANFDVEIAVDAVYSMNQYKTFILFSGDCDFEYLLKFLRGQGKITLVFSRTGHIAKELPPASNYYFDIVDFRNDFLRMELKNKQAKNPA